MEIKNRKPGGSVDKVFGITEQRILDIVANARGDGDVEYPTIGDMLHHNLKFCDTIEEAVVLAYMMGGYEQAKMKEHRILGGQDGDN